MPRSAWYTLGFAAAICLVCSVLVTSAAVTLKSRQDENLTLDRQCNVLLAAGLLEEGEDIAADEVARRFASFEAVVVDLKTGQEVPDIDPDSVDQRKMARNPARSFEVDSNPALIKRVANQAVVYKLVGEGGELKKLVLPIEGQGLWGALYGFVAVGGDMETIEGLTFYEHKETPGLGGEVDNPNWKALWPGRKIYGADGEVRIKVVKGPAGPASEDPYQVDGLSGATITSRGVTNLLAFWLSDQGFGEYFDTFRELRRAA